MSVILKDARKLADFLISRQVHLYVHTCHIHSQYNHLGALLTDIVLQSGLNYNTVVRPRVRRVLEEFYYATTTPLLKQAVKVYGAEFLMNWKNPIKTNRFKDILEFCDHHRIEDEDQLRYFLVRETNRQKFLEIHGVGPKTTDYALKLMGVECVAVDRHIYSFVKEAGIEAKEYQKVKLIVEYAADLLCLSRSGVDYFIWSSVNKRRPCVQTSIFG